jgi:hypothetical protein
MCDALDSWNCHSAAEAVDDLRHGPAGIGREMSVRIQQLLRRKTDLQAFFPGMDAAAAETELRDMDALLHVMAKCAGEPRNYREFLDHLIPLLEMCRRWSERGPLDAAGARDF